MDPKLEPQILFWKVFRVGKGIYPYRVPEKSSLRRIYHTFILENTSISHMQGDHNSIYNNWKES